MAKSRAVSVDEILKQKFIEMPFEGVWKDFLGDPERSGVWLIWGHSGNGKTSFMLQLSKYLTNFGRVAYNTLEEGTRKSMQLAIKRANMLEVSKKFILLNREPMEELKERLRKKKSPDIVIIDSFQYTGLNKRDYIALKEEFSNKLIVFVSHADGKHPEGRTAKFVRFDADVKIRVEGYKAFPASRLGGGEPYVIWNEGAEKYYTEIN